MGRCGLDWRDIVGIYGAVYGYDVRGCTASCSTLYMIWHCMTDYEESTKRLSAAVVHCEEFSEICVGGLPYRLKAFDVYLTEHASLARIWCRGLSKLKPQRYCGPLSPRVARADHPRSLSTLMVGMQRRLGPDALLGARQDAKGVDEELWQLCAIRAKRVSSVLKGSYRD
jgi:hypothetical protein